MRRPAAAARPDRTPARLEPSAPRYIASSDHAVPSGIRTAAISTPAPAGAGRHPGPHRRERGLAATPTATADAAAEPIRSPARSCGPRRPSRARAAPPAPRRVRPAPGDDAGPGSPGPPSRYSPTNRRPRPWALDSTSVHPANEPQSVANVLTGNLSTMGTVPPDSNADANSVAAVVRPTTAGLHHGMSLLGGWLPLLVEVTAAVVVLWSVGWRTRRWRLGGYRSARPSGWPPRSPSATCVNTQGLASDPAPCSCGCGPRSAPATVPMAALGWRGARWWRRGLSVLAIPLTLLATLLALNKWVGYYPTVQSAWGALTAGPLPDRDRRGRSARAAQHLAGHREVGGGRIPDTASGFRHRDEYVYLPPAWFAGRDPARAARGDDDRRRVQHPGGLDAQRQHHAGYRRATRTAHGGVAPVFVFVDSGGRFNNDTECVNGPRGNAADHLTKDVRPYVISQFGASSDPAQLGGRGVVDGWHVCHRPDGHAPRPVQHLRGHRR